MGLSSAGSLNPAGLAASAGSLLTGAGLARPGAARRNDTRSSSRRKARIGIGAPRSAGEGPADRRSLAKGRAGGQVGGRTLAINSVLKSLRHNRRSTAAPSAPMPPSLVAEVRSFIGGGVRPLVDFPWRFTATLSKH